MLANLFASPPNLFGDTPSGALAILPLKEIQPSLMLPEAIAENFNSA